jgi:hypothetical protein
MPLNINQYYEQVAPLANRYKMENKWVTWRGDDRFILNAYRLYLAAAKAALGFIVLGDTKIRKDPSLVQNFGLASAGGVQEMEELKLVKRLQSERRLLPFSPKVVGPGSILSDRNWTPLLNDSLMMGGFHMGQDFVFAEDRAGNVPRTNGDAKTWWLSVFNRYADIIWNNEYRIPRVFARELLGLKTFGYTPVFSNFQLGFRPGQGAGATFRAYLDSLSSYNFSMNDKGRIVGGISEFLFGDRSAIAI